MIHAYEVLLQASELTVAEQEAVETMIGRLQENLLKGNKDGQYATSCTALGMGEDRPSGRGPWSTVILSTILKPFPPTRRE